MKRVKTEQGDRNARARSIIISARSLALSLSLFSLFLSDLVLPCPVLPASQDAHPLLGSLDRREAPLWEFQNIMGLWSRLTMRILK